MNIKEAELRTGITKQNIRFYEKKGLLSPKRNKENSYREYTEDDIKRLLSIKVWRKLDLSIENIHRIFDGEPEETVLEEHLQLLLEKQNDINASVKMCQFLIRSAEASLDAEAVLLKMEQIEQKGGRFMNILNDYKKVADVEAKRKFSFFLDSIVSTPEEITEALLTYGREKNLNLVVTKEGIYPKFEIDGLEYEACRYFSRYGSVIACKVTDPKLLEDKYKEILPNRRRIYRAIYWVFNLIAIPVIFFLYFTISVPAACIALFILVMGGILRYRLKDYC